MVIWLLFAIVTACAILVIARPLTRAVAPARNSSPEIEAYRLQLAELNRDEQRGTLGKEEAEQTRNEISRRLLKAGRQNSASESTANRNSINGNIALAVLASAVALGAAGLYARFGAPGLPDEPLEARLNAPVESQSLAIQIANVERRLHANPKDALGWKVIAPVYFRIGQFDKAADAYRKALQYGGEDEDKLLGLFESLTYANEGAIPPEAKPALDAALSRNSKSLRARLWLAVLAGQEGRKDEAHRIFQQMLGEDIPAAWKGLIQQQLAVLSDEGPGASASQTGQTSGDPLQGEQGAMIRGMVEKLAARLKDNAADLDGWLKLIRSYAVLKETVKAKEAAASARAQFASDPKALEQIDNLVLGLGLGHANEKAEVPKS